MLNKANKYPIPIPMVDPSNLVSGVGEIVDVVVSIVSFNPIPTLIEASIEELFFSWNSQWYDDLRGSSPAAQNTPLVAEKREVVCKVEGSNVYRIYLKLNDVDLAGAKLFAAHLSENHKCDFADLVVIRNVFRRDEEKISIYSVLDEDMPF